MQCPVDGTELAMTDHSGVEIDYCPQCRGIWLDRGALDKIIERTTGDRSAVEGPRQSAPRSQKARSRKQSDWFELGDLFDF
ncbi:MAG: zf-TFIIB domain-containing protein [Pseudomonadota bacterium]